MRKQFTFALVLLLCSAAFANAQTSTLFSGSVSISAFTPPNPRPGSGYFNSNLSLSFTAGTVYEIQTAVAVLPALSVDTYIYLLDPTGNVVGQDDDNGLGLGNPFGSRLSYTATVTGNYTLVVTTYSAGISYSNVPVTVTYPTPVGNSTTGVPNVKLQLPKKDAGKAQYALESLMGGDRNVSVRRPTAVRPGIFATMSRRGSLPIFRES